ncbi:thiamine-binding protein [Candidatus Bathyarchaeota archaeon]|nr:MAG: thiamine-binding protein [Candidatus Bathyarchaeota archaeon]
MVIIEFNIVPLGVGVSLSKFIAPALEEVKRRKVRYEITPMCTIFEAENLDESLEIVKAAHKAVLKAGVKRVVTTIRIDDRRDKERGMEEKVKALKRWLKE